MSVYYDYIISGQGIAGSILSYFLRKEGKKVLVVDNNPPFSSTKVTAGIISPVTGRFVAKSWRAEEIIPFAMKTYLEIEELLREKFFYPKPIFRAFKSAEQGEQWMQKSDKEEIRQFIEEPWREAVDPNIASELGGFVIKESGYLDTVVFIDAWRHYLDKTGSLHEGLMDYNKISFTSSGVKWKDIKAEKILFCEGYKATLNPWFHWLPFRPAKGEVLIIKCEGLENNYILNKGVHLVPLGNNLYKAGSTFSWNFPDEVPTESGKQELIQRLSGMIKVPFTVLDHQAGVRPAVKDYRPFVGIHPENHALGIFNGLGTKGIFLSPFFACQFARHLVADQPVDNEVNISRFWKG